MGKITPYFNEDRKSKGNTRRREDDENKDGFWNGWRVKSEKAGVPKTLQE